MKTESTFGSKAIAKIKNSNSKAIGLMQITDYTLKLIKEDQKEPSPLELAEEYKGIRNDKSFMANKQRQHFKETREEYKKAKIK